MEVYRASNAKSCLSRRVSQPPSDDGQGDDWRKHSNDGKGHFTGVREGDSVAHYWLATGVGIRGGDWCGAIVGSSEGRVEEWLAGVTWCYVPRNH
ncbi:hypothetical protein ANTRET_LOCUS6285 [Anthophora retusa]